ncbi:MAG: RNA pyrophosphohydrolase [Actinomycetota bacterium]
MRRLLDHRGTPSDSRLMEALLQLDTYSANKARKGRTLRNERTILTLTLLFALIAIFLVVVVGDDVDLDDLSFGNAKLVLLAQLFGIIGASLSAIQRTSKRPEMRVPEQRGAAFASMIRPFTGAGAALVVVAGVEAGLLGDEPATVLLGAFAAGFSERYVLRFVPNQEEEEEEGEEGPGAGETPDVSGAASDHDRYFRAGVGMVVLNDSNQVLALERSDHPGSWQYPQGGIESGESPRDAAFRELREETGLMPPTVELIHELPQWHTYELPDELRSRKTGRGQTHKWFLFRMHGAEDVAVPLPRTGETEFRACKWVEPLEVARQAVEFRRVAYLDIATTIERLDDVPARPQQPPPD